MGDSQAEPRTLGWTYDGGQPGGLPTPTPRQRIPRSRGRVFDLNPPARARNPGPGSLVPDPWSRTRYPSTTGPHLPSRPPEPRCSRTLIGTISKSHVRCARGRGPPKIQLRPRFRQVAPLLRLVNRLRHTRPLRRRRRSSKTRWLITSWRLSATAPCLAPLLAAPLGLLFTVARMRSRTCREA